MSFTVAPNWNSFIDRLALILQSSSLLMPASNGSTTAEDKVKQIIKYQFPLPEQPPDGEGPPHIFVTRPDNPILRKEQTGRDSKDEHGPEKWTLEFYIVSVVLRDDDPMKSQEDLYDITQAILTTLGKNRRLITPGGAGTDPMAYHLETYDVPFLLKTNQTNLYAHNVVVRIQILVNMRP